MSTPAPISVDTETATAAGINDILRTLGHVPLPLSLPSDDLSAWTVPELQEEVRRLRTEVWRLNPSFFTAALPLPSEGQGEDVEVEGDEHGAEAVVRAIRNLQNNSALAGSSEVSELAEGSASPATAKSARSKAAGQGKKRKRTTLDRHVETGKRMEKGRRTELSKVLRARMRAALSISENDPLPDPLESEDGQVVVPDWGKAGEEKGLNWVDGIATEVYNEAIAGGLPSIPAEDVDFEIIKSTARIAFHNFARKYIVENDPAKAEKKSRQAKGRRRWARKDLKQKRRIRASQDPAFAGSSFPPGALQLDYMSSEYSSLAEDTDEEGADPEIGKAGVSEGRKAEWEAKTLALPAEVDPAEASKGWAEGLGTKLLEVRTPRWRSDQLNSLYARLDGIATARTSQRLNPTLMDAAGGVRPGHVAPSHHRFSMPPHLRRRGSKRRETNKNVSQSGDDGWMWKSGVVGVWPPLPAKDPVDPANSMDPVEEIGEVEGVISGDIWEGYPPL